MPSGKECCKLNGDVSALAWNTYMEAISELLRTEACWPAWLVLGGPLEGMLPSPKAAPKLFSSRLHPACMPKHVSGAAHMQDLDLYAIPV